MLARGKLPAVFDPRVPSIGRFRATLPLPLLAPDSADWLSKPKHFGVLANDTIGLCTVASSLHIVQTLSANSGAEIIPDVPCAVADYAHATALISPPGFNPATGENDTGLACHDVLQFWMKNGFAIYADGSLDLLDGYAYIDPGDIATIKACIAMFGTVKLGVELPDSAEREFLAGAPWADTSGLPGGGHCVPAGRFDAYTMSCVTWGGVQPMTWAWWKKYGVEAYVPLRRTWIGATGRSPSGVTMAALTEQLNEMRGLLGFSAI